jgi:hypothetical protein
MNLQKIVTPGLDPGISGESTPSPSGIICDRPELEAGGEYASRGAVTVARSLLSCGNGIGTHIARSLLVFRSVRRANEARERQQPTTEKSRMSATISRAEFDFLARRAGLTLTEAQATELMGVYPLIAAMTERNRNGRGREAEPMHIFIPGEPGAGDGSAA